jgi:hypothetical protein
MHFPELIINTFQIILIILKKTNETNLINFFELFNLNKFSSCFEIYKFKLKGCFKEANFLYLNIILVLFSFFKQKQIKKNLFRQEKELKFQNGNEKENDLEFRTKYLNIFESLCLIFCGFFDITHKRYIDFTKKKFKDIHLQDLLLRIGSVIISYEIALEYILNSDFMNNLIRFVIEFSFGKCEYNKNILNNRSQDRNKFDFLIFISQNKIKNFEIIKKICSSIVLNLLDIYANLLNHDNKYFTIVANNVKYI